MGWMEKTNKQSIANKVQKYHIILPGTATIACKSVQQLKRNHDPNAFFGYLSQVGRFLHELHRFYHGEEYCFWEGEPALFQNSSSFL